MCKVQLDKDSDTLTHQEEKTPRYRSFSRRIKRRPSISRSLTVSSSSSEAGPRPRVQFVQRRVSDIELNSVSDTKRSQTQPQVDNGLSSQHLPRAHRQRSTTTPRTVDMRQEDTDMSSCVTLLVCFQEHDNQKKEKV